jgi:PUB domain
MDIESGSKSSGNTMDIESSPQLLELKTELNEIYRDIMGTENFFSALLTIHTLVSNIAQNPNEEKFRKLNLEKPTLSALFSKSPAIERVFKLVGFRQNGHTQIFQLGEPGKPLKNFSLIEASCREIKDFGDKIGMNFSYPSQAKTRSRGGRILSHRWKIKC